MKTKISDHFKITKGRHYPSPSKSEFWDHKDGFLWLKVGDIKPYIYNSQCKLSSKGVATIKNAQNFLFKKNSFVMAVDGSIGKIGWLKENCFSSTHLINFNCDDLILKKYLYYFFIKNCKKVFILKIGTVVPSIKLWQLENLEINLPDQQKLKKIEQIITKLHLLSEYSKKLQKKIDSLQEKIILSLCVQNKGKTKISNHFKITQGRHYPSPSKSKFWDHKSGFLWLKIGDIKPYTYNSQCKLSSQGVATIKNNQKFFFKKDSFVMAKVGVGSVGKVGWLKNDFYSSTAIVNFESDDSILKKYLYYFFKRNRQKIFSLKIGTAIPSVKLKQLENLEINLPDQKDLKKVEQIITKLHLLSEYNWKLQEKIELLQQNILSN